MNSTKKVAPRSAQRRPAQAAAAEPARRPALERIRGWAPAAFVLLLALAMLLANLGDQRLWQDEAQTALIAGTVLTHGVPLGHDGRNSFSQDRGEDYGRNYVWLWHPWLSFYVLAGFFAVFGKSTLVARLPFALFGVGTVLLAFHFGRLLWRSRRAGFLAALVLLLNVPFLVLSRQCRYYAPDMFFALLGLFGYWRVLERRKHSALLFGVAAIALFHTHYVHCAALLATAILHAVLFRRDRLKQVLLIAGVTAIVSVPWVLWFSTMGRTLGAQAAGGSMAIPFGLQFVEQIGRSMFSPWLLLLAAAAWVVLRSRRGRRASPDPALPSKIALLLLFVAVTLVATCFTATYPFFRFIAPLIPAACLLTALILESVARIHRVAGPAVALFVLLALGHAWSVPDYLYEITHHYRGPVDGIVEYLGKHARKDDVVAMTYEDLPVKFYTGLRVVGGLTGEDLAPARTADWIIIRKYVISDKDLYVRNYLVSEVPLREYTAISLDAPDLPFQNREEPGAHLFRTAKDDPVVILRKPGSGSR